jgi:hypothetical protein
MFVNPKPWATLRWTQQLEVEQQLTDRKILGYGSSR